MSWVTGEIVTWGEPGEIGGLLVGLKDSETLRHVKCHEDQRLGESGE